MKVSKSTEEAIEMLLGYRKEYYKHSLHYLNVNGRDTVAYFKDEDDYDHEFLRGDMVWGRGLDADGNSLPETEYILLKDLTDDHLDAIIKWVHREDHVYSNKIKLVMVNEKKYREENNLDKK